MINDVRDESGKTRTGGYKTTTLTNNQFYRRLVESYRQTYSNVHTFLIIWRLDEVPTSNLLYSSVRMDRHRCDSTYTDAKKRSLSHLYPRNWSDVGPVSTETECTYRYKKVFFSNPKIRDSIGKERLKNDYGDDQVNPLTYSRRMGRV